jgi:hypothetical protein
MVTGIILLAAGGFSRLTPNVVEPTGNPPHPALATTANAIGVAEAGPPVSGVTPSQEGRGLIVLSTVNGVPPLAGEVTFTVTAGAGV